VYWRIPVGFFGGHGSSGTLSFSMGVYAEGYTPPARDGYLEIIMPHATYNMYLRDYSSIWPTTLFVDYFYACCRNMNYEAVFNTVREGRPIYKFFVSNAHEGDSVTVNYHDGLLTIPLFWSGGTHPYMLLNGPVDNCFFGCGNGGLPYLEQCWVDLDTAHSGFTGFQILSDTDTLRTFDSLAISAIRPVAVGSDGAEVPLDPNTLLTFAVDSTRLVKFIGVNGDTLPSPLTNVKYGDARQGKIKIVSVAIPKHHFTPTRITVSDIPDPSKTGFKVVPVRRVLKWVRIPQSGSPWGGQYYDHEPDSVTISSIGCCLTSVAMVMNAFGVNVRVDTLNNWMTRNNLWVAGKKKTTINGRDTTIVYYDLDPTTIKRYPGNSFVKAVGAVGNGIRATKPLHRPPLSSWTIPTYLFEPWITDTSAVIVQVYNSGSRKTTTGQHWVVVTSATNGQYSILDPGRLNTTLAQYNNTIYRFWIFKSQ
jgi:hypothetical protein